VRRLGAQTSTGMMLCGECSEQEATVICEQCAGAEPVCEPCFVALHPTRSKAKKDHVPKPSSAPTVALCLVHKKPLSHFCSHERCWKSLCETCVSTHSSSADPAQHSVTPLPEFAAHFLAQLKQAGHLSTVKEGIDTLASMVQAWLDQSRQAQRQVQQTQLLISQRTVELTQTLHAKSKVSK